LAFTLVFWTLIMPYLLTSLYFVLGSIA
jgi:hypothetical protein